jgi:hypothetical protein
MIAVLTVMSNMDFSHDQWDILGLGLVKCWVWIVLGYRGVTCELCLVLVTGVRPMSSVWLWL